jgi:Mrp family chromosome partitioning ATPase
MIVALLIPVGSGSAYPADTWSAPAKLGLTPSNPTNQLGSKLGIRQLAFYAHAPAVLAAAASADNVPLTPGMASDVIATKAHVPGAAASTLQVAVLQPTKHGAVSLTNAFVSALSSYAQLQLANLHRQQISNEQNYIANLEKAIAALPRPSRPTPTTTPTTLPRTKPKKATRSEAADTGSTTTTTVPGNTGAGTAGGGTTGTSVPGVAGSTTPTTTLTLPNRTLIEENQVLSQELGNATGTLSKLMAQGAPSAGIKVIEPARADSAVRLNPNPPLLSNWFLRALLGLVLGALLGVIATWLVDAFDRRLRTSKRAEEVFALPVIVEIPAAQSKSVSPIPVVDVVVDPYSAASEAYRRLHVAILTAPPVTWVRRGYGPEEELLELPMHRPDQRVLVGAAAPAPAGTTPATAVPDPASADAEGAATDPATAPTGQVQLPVRARAGALSLPHRSRFSILVTSATDEPTRSLVVVNLAAVFAEAGDRVLVATTGGMRTSFDGNGRMPPTWEGPYSELTAAELVGNARPSQIPGVSSLALGQLFPNPSKLALNTPGLIEAARDVVDVLLLEAPLLSTQDGTALMPSADLVVVVCEAWRTTVNDGLRSQRLLAQHRPPVLGLVMTNMEADYPSLSVTAS